MKFFLPVFTLVLLFCSSATAQFLTPQYHSYLSSNVMYLEVLGSGATISMNYEQLYAQGEFFAAGGRYGFGVLPLGDGEIRYATPVTISTLFGKDRLFFELGGGIRIDFDNHFIERGGIDIIPTGIAGIRMHPTHRGGLFLKLAYTPDYVDQTLVHRAGFGIGFGFSSQRRR